MILRASNHIGPRRSLSLYLVYPKRNSGHSGIWKSTILFTGMLPFPPNS